jgi:hypothetical protein
MATLTLLAGFFCTLGKVSLIVSTLIVIYGIYKIKVVDYVENEQEAELRQKEGEKKLAEDMQAYSEAPTVSAWDVSVKDN